MLTEVDRETGRGAASKFSAFHIVFSLFACEPTTATAIFTYQRTTMGAYTTFLLHTFGSQKYEIFEKTQSEEKV